MTPLLRVAALAVIAAQLAAPAPIRSIGDCAAHGFVPGVLECSTCGALAATLGAAADDGAAAACLACCSDVVGLSSTRRHASARIVLPRAALGGGFAAMFQQGQQQQKRGEGGEDALAAAPTGVREWAERHGAAWGDLVQVVRSSSSLPLQGEGAGGGGGASSEARLVFSDESGAEEASVDVSTWKEEHIEALVARKVLL